MAQDLSHLVNDSAEASADGDVLHRVAQLAEEFKRKQARVKELEEELKTAKKDFNKTSQEEIPELLMQHGLNSVELATGEKLSIKEDVSASIKDMAAFYDFLVERGDEAIVKTDMVFGKIPVEVITKIQNWLSDTFELYPEVKQSVHYQTLQKYIRELCGIGSDKAAELSLSELDEEVVSAFTFYKTTVK